MHTITTGTVFLYTAKYLKKLDKTPIEMGKFQRRVLNQKMKIMTKPILLFGAVQKLNREES